MTPAEKKLRYQHISLLKKKEAQGAKKTTVETLRRSLTASTDEGLAQFVNRGSAKK